MAKGDSKAVWGQMSATPGISGPTHAVTRRTVLHSVYVFWMVNRGVDQGSRGGGAYEMTIQMLLAPAKRSHRIRTGIRLPRCRARHPSLTPTPIEFTSRVKPRHLIRGG